MNLGPLTRIDIDLAVKAARRAFERGPWSRMTHGQRGKLIWKLVLDFLESGKADGGKTVAGGNRVGDRGYFVEPTILTERVRG